MLLLLAGGAQDRGSGTGQRDVASPATAELKAVLKSQDPQNQVRGSPWNLNILVEIGSLESPRGVGLKHWGSQVDPKQPPEEPPVTQCP